MSGVSGGVVMVCCLCLLNSSVYAQDYLHPEISINRLEGVVQTLSSAKFRGRRYNSAENKLVADWLATKLDEMGIDAPEEGRIQESGNIQNVLGFIPGEDDTETIVIGAHYDHLGIRFDKIYYGADDNASGCAAVLEIARAFIELDIKPKRNVVFAFFDGEETGKYGSKLYLAIVDTPHWVAVHDPPVFMLNFDMVGRIRNNQVKVGGLKSSPKVQHWISEANKNVSNLTLRTFRSPKLNSDDATFVAYGVPVLRLFSGSHSDYHRPTDVWDKINFDGLKDVTELGFHIAKNAALDDLDLRQYVNPNHPVAINTRIEIGLRQRQSLN